MSLQCQSHIQVSLTRLWKCSFGFENPWLSKEKERNTKAPTTCQTFDLNDSPEIALACCDKKKERKNMILQGKTKKCPFLFILLLFFIHRAPYNSKAQQDRRPSLFSDPVTFPQPQAVTTWHKSDMKKKAMLAGSSPIPLYSSTICCQQGRQDNTMVFISKGQLSTKQKRGYTWKFWILSKVSEKLPLLISDKASFSSGLLGSHRETWGLVVFKWYTCGSKGLILI